MYLKRKQSAEVITTLDGVQHPDAVVCVASFENKVGQSLSIEARVYHSRDAYLDKASNINIGSVVFNFTQQVSVPDVANAAEVVTALQANSENKYEVLKTINLGNSGYNNVIENSVALSAGVELITPQAKLWVMEQVDMFGIPFRENWDLYDEDGNLFDYEATLIAILTA